MNRMTEEGRKQLEELIAQVMKDGQARGIAVGIVDSDGQIQYENYFGYRDEENQLPITRDFRNGVCYKIFYGIGYYADAERRTFVGR